uniref:Ras-GEF domain-containing protein n=1 Tax=Arcella intermedia TaxID=1963864 RepID=A0A6B2KY17_9EUKA
MLVFGGLDSTSKPTNDLLLIDQTGAHTLMAAKGDLPPARAGHQALLLKQKSGAKMYVFGGRDEVVFFNDVYCLDVGSGVWSQVVGTGEVPCGRVFSSCCLISDKIFVYGGCDSNGADLSDFYQLNLQTNTWTSIPLKGSIIPPPKSGHTLVSIKNDKEIILFGGDEKATAFEIYKYTLKDQQWSLVTYTGDSATPRKYHATTTFGYKLFLFGGIAQEPPLLDTIELLSNASAQQALGPVEAEENEGKYKEWEARAMKQFPHVLALREQLRGFLPTPASYSITSAVARTENPEALHPARVVPLLVEFLRESGFKETANKLIEETRLGSVEMSGDATLKKILDFSKRLFSDVSLFSPELINYKFPWDQAVDKEILDFSKRLFSDVSLFSPELINYKFPWDQAVDKEIRNLVHLPGFYVSKNGVDNIWEDDESTLMRSMGDVISGNLNVLLLHLVHRSGRDFKLAFFFTYKNWSTTDIVMKKLIEIYNVPEDVSKTDAKRIKRAILSLFLVWMEEIPLDFTDPPIANAFQLFLETPSIHDNQQALKDIKTSLKRSLKNWTKLQNPDSVCEIDNPPDPLVPKNIFSSDLKLEDVDVIEVARQLTLYAFHRFIQIPLTEFSTGGWREASSTDEGGDWIQSAMAFHHRTRLWTKSEMEMDPKQKGKKIKYFVALCSALYELQNFDSLAAVILGMYGVENPENAKWDSIHDDPVFSKTPSDIAKVKNWVSIIFDNGTNSYENTLSTIKQFSFVPYLNVHLQNIIKVLDAEEFFVKSTNNQIINFSKSVKLLKFILELRDFQRQKFNLLPVIQIQLCFNAFPEYIPKHSKKNRK